MNSMRRIRLARQAARIQAPLTGFRDQLNTSKTIPKQCNAHKMNPAYSYFIRPTTMFMNS